MSAQTKESEDRFTNPPPPPPPSLLPQKNVIRILINFEKEITILIFETDVFSYIQVNAHQNFKKVFRRFYDNRILASLA